MTSPTSAPTGTIFLRPVGQVWPDGTQMFAVVDSGPAVWNATTAYAVGNHVVGSDGHVYVAKVANLVNVNPVGDANVHWQGLW